jgi:S-adenosylmethionine:tRNA ribosyltransferase-isomerase
LKTSDFDFVLPAELVAGTPAVERDASRLLVLDRVRNTLEHRMFRDILGWFKPGDVLVLNDSKVIPARLHGRKVDTGGLVEILLLEEVSPLDWWVLLRPGKRVRPGSKLRFSSKGGRSGVQFTAELLEKNEEGHCRLRFESGLNLFRALQEIGEIPLPPYIESQEERGGVDDRSRYQTVYAKPEGSVAAPTAGLHFTLPLLDQIRERGVDVQTVTLHVGAGTFLPVKSEELEDHRMHSERFEIREPAAAAIRQARMQGGRIVAVGTTTVRVLESVAQRNSGVIQACEGRTDIFIRPPFHFHAVDALITNFHLPQSTLLMLVSAFADPSGSEGRGMILGAYREAVEQRYRFYSYGDAMLIHGDMEG